MGRVSLQIRHTKEETANLTRFRLENTIFCSSPLAVGANFFGGGSMTRKLLPPPVDASEPPADVKHTEEAIERRRRFVQESVIRGIPASTIAKQLGVHRNTIVNDIREIRKENSRKVAEADVLEEIGEAAAFFEQVAQEAMFGVTDHDHPMAKVSFLSIAMKAKADKIRLLSQVGVIPHAPRGEQRPSAFIFGEDVDLDAMGVEELRQLRDRVLSELYAMKESESAEATEAQVIADPKEADANNCTDGE